MQIIENQKRAPGVLKTWGSKDGGVKATQDSDALRLEAVNVTDNTIGILSEKPLDGKRIY